ncbi:MAG: helix-turn-helix domain-containing protein [Solirubrobacteraceae bacterium]
MAVARGAETSAPRATPLTLVSGAIAGDDLERVTASVAHALHRPVAIAIPALGAPVFAPPGSLSAAQLDAVAAHAVATIAGRDSPAPAAVRESVAVQIGDEVVGIVAAGPARAERIGVAESRAWLQAAAAAASVTALIRDAQNGDAETGAAKLLHELRAGPPEDLAGFLSRARRCGVELGAGAVAISARATASSNLTAFSPPPRYEGVLTALTAPGRLLALAPLDSEPTPDGLAGRLRELGMEVAISAPRRYPSALAEALREAELLLELAGAPGSAPAPAAAPGTPPPDPAAPDLPNGHGETYRLLIGVLLRDPDELAQLRERTISSLVSYDQRHDTDLLATLQAFLAHDGSTTETAEAMALHRHTVGYRLSRVHEVSGLSPYESDGRERLSLGLKAHQILEADAQRVAASGAGSRR